MGVSGLLPLLKSIQRPTELKKCSGQTLGVDAYGWLHRAAYSCALELGQGKSTTKFINAALHRVRMLHHFGIAPYMVFDGDYLPSKANTEDSRSQQREKRKKVAMELLKAGKPAQATQEFQKCIDITPEMACALIQHLKQMGIKYVVAPYEADAQLVYLEKHGLIDGILSDDSDLLVFGAKRLLTKLDGYGNCIEINRRNFSAVREVSLTGMTDAEFRRMAIFSGCDYTEGVQGIGLKKAHRYLRKTKSPERIVKLMQLEGIRVNENFLSIFYQAELTFLHQWVFDPRTKQLVHLNDLEGGRTAEEMPYIGSQIDAKVARAVAEGLLHPMTKSPIVLPPSPSKRRHSQTHTAAALPDRTPTKPINSYFKGHRRIPMGEMDPNCFKVDPQRAAQGMAPRVFPLPRPYIEEAPAPRPYTHTRSNTAPTRTSPRLQKRRTEPIAKLLTEVSAAKSPVRTTKTTPESTIRPQKKARLCDDSYEDTSPKQSKFFSIASKTTRKAKSDAFLMSDDSISEALSKLPEWDGFKAQEKPETSFQVFEEQSQSTPQDEGDNRGKDSQAAPLRKRASETILVPSLGSQPTGSSQMLPPPKTRSPLRRAETSITPAAAVKRLSYLPSSINSSASSVPSSVFSMASDASTPATAASSRLTPLQRLGAKVINSPASPRPRNTRSVSGLGHTLPKTLGKGKGNDINPAFVPLPKVDLKEMEALNKSCGSEDMMVPDSDEDDNEPDTHEEDVVVRRLDLAKFAYE